MRFHCRYGYVFSKIKDPSALPSGVADIRARMAVNELQLNDNKTESVTICAPWLRDAVSVDDLTIGTSNVAAAPTVRNRGVIVDQALNVDSHIHGLCQTSLAILRTIVDIRRSLTQLIHAFVTSLLDYCNGRLFGVSPSTLRRLQQVQNSSTHIFSLANVNTITSYTSVRLFYRYCNISHPRLEVFRVKHRHSCGQG